jgi:hypothetical protein
MTTLVDLARQIRRLPERYNDPQRLAARAASMVEAFALAQTDTPAVDLNTPRVAHTCNPGQPGKPLPFGKRAPIGTCERCDQLRAGADPIPGWGVDKVDEDERRAAEIRAHFAGDKHRSGGCGPVCTFGDW